MKIPHMFMVALLAATSLGIFALAADNRKEASNSATVVSTTDQNEAMRIEGEKRFHANCGRCHAAPHKFSPRMMATIVRHMRVRATITDEDMRLILHYMTE